MIYGFDTETLRAQKKNNDCKKQKLMNRIYCLAIFMLLLLFQEVKIFKEVAKYK